MRHTFVRWAAVLAVLAVASLARPASLAAQTGKITGVVRDATSNQPLEGVEVFIEGTGITVNTASNGRFFFISVAPGVYTLVARRPGYQSVSTRGVNVVIDVTREQNFTLAPAQGVQLQAITVEAEATPLVEPGVSSSAIGISGDVIRALPVVSIEGALRLQQGFLQVPNNTDIISFNESRRDATNPIRIRGGRAGETLTLIDGIPVNNWIYGGPAISPTPEAVQQLDYIKGGMEPQYGNALSGIINVASRDGGTNLAGAVRFQSSAPGGWLGSRQDELQDYTLVEGFLSGPVPSTNNKLRFMVSGRQERGADQVLQFDNLVTQPSNPNSGFYQKPFPTSYMDVFPGWRAFGYNNERQVFGKLTYYLKPTMKLGFTVIDDQQQRQPFDFIYLLSYGDPLKSPVINTLADSEAVWGNRFGERVGTLEFTKVVEGSINAGRRLFVGRLDHTIGRTSYHLALGHFSLGRTTCNWFQGVCLGTNFGDPNFTDDQFISGLSGTCAVHPTCGTDYFYGGEKLRTIVVRGDVESQVSDHHNLQAGLMVMSHDVTLNQVQNIGGNNVIAYYQAYRAHPWDAAFYVQDRIEYDFLTVKLGGRFDLGSAGGKFWKNPLDPTNGTTASTVCLQAGDPRWQNVPVTQYDPAGDSTYTTRMSANPNWATLGINCGGVDSVLSQAAKIASSDDFGQSKKRRQFSPRIGVNFPLGTGSGLFFNFDRNTQNPLLNNLFIGTGIGTTREGTTQGPQLFTPSGAAIPFFGNPSLLTEQTTSYEIGYASEIGQDYAIGVTAFSKDQVGLTGIRTGGFVNGVAVFDPGVTYGTNSPQYNILVNQDFQTVRGIEVQLRRRVSHYWGFDINYSFSEARTNASDPEKEFQRQIQQGDPRLNAEVTSDVDQPHVFNASLIFQVAQDYPKTRFGSLLQDLSSSVTVRAQSGFPYTPLLDFQGIFGGLGKLVRNTGRGPSTFQIDWQVSKNFSISNLRYGLVVQVLNVTDRHNCIQVFVTTGQCTVGSVDLSREREGNPVIADAVTSTFLNHPEYFGARRSIQAGLRVSF